MSVTKMPDDELEKFLRERNAMGDAAERHIHAWEWDSNEAWFICKNCPEETDEYFVVMGPSDMLSALQASQRGNERLRKVLREAEKAIASLEEEALGRVPNHPDYGLGWPIRDELLSRIDAALKEVDDG